MWNLCLFYFQGDTVDVLELQVHIVVRNRPGYKYAQYKLVSSDLASQHILYSSINGNQYTPIPSYNISPCSLSERSTAVVAARV